LDTPIFGLIIVGGARPIPRTVPVANQGRGIDRAGGPVRRPPGDLQISPRRIAVVHPPGYIAKRYARLTVAQIRTDRRPLGLSESGSTQASLLPDHASGSLETPASRAKGLSAAPARATTRTGSAARREARYAAADSSSSSGSQATRIQGKESAALCSSPRSPT